MFFGNLILYWPGAANRFFHPLSKDVASTINKIMLTPPPPFPLAPKIPTFPFFPGPQGTLFVPLPPS